MAILFYVNAMMLDYHDSPSMTQHYLKRLSYMAERFSEGKVKGLDIFLRNLLDDTDVTHHEKLERTLFLSRMMVIAKRLGRTCGWKLGQPFFGSLE